MLRSKLTLFVILFLFSLGAVFFNQSWPILLFKDFISESLRPVVFVLNESKNKFLFWPTTFLNIKNPATDNTESPRRAKLRNRQGY